MVFLVSGFGLSKNANSEQPETRNHFQLRTQNGNELPNRTTWRKLPLPDLPAATFRLAKRRGGLLPITPGAGLFFGGTGGTGRRTRGDRPIDPLPPHGLAGQYRGGRALPEAGHGPGDHPLPDEQGPRSGHPFAIAPGDQRGRGTVPNDGLPRPLRIPVFLSSGRGVRSLSLSVYPSL